ncbi:acyltransferase family protein [Citricoccus sp. NPDC055426]|uniref:acyltransferase family protein n=1 Tax=Citricoccus sp. NPDC055426 TaxID=3155536 RepID=UPI003445CA56
MATVTRTLVPPAVPGGTTSGEKKKTFRADIQGLRAVAVGVVLLYHAGVPLVPGGYIGVDVFFVISGFLITGLLLKELGENGRISLAGFYARRARRILPAGLIVLAVTALLSVLFLPRTRWDEIGVQIIASAFNGVNWVFAASEADYLQAGAAASPLQHFWTLAVEEQFYIVWPLLLVAAAFFARAGGARRGRRGGRRAVPDDGRRLRVLVISAVLIILLPSLAYSVHLTTTDPGPAYFVTTTRLYELGIGALVAVFATQLARLNRTVALALGWAGLAAVVAAAVLYSADTAFPGAAALLPTLGSAAIIVSGMAGRDRTGVGRLLCLRPMVWVGGVSYSLYLWHWPLVVIADHLMGGLTVPAGLAVVVLSFLPAYASLKCIEQPFMRWRFVQPSVTALQVGAIGMLSLAIVGGSFPLLMRAATPAPVPAVTAVQQGGNGAGGASVYGAEALAVEPSTGLVENVTAGYTPSAVDAAADQSRVYADGCHVTGSASAAQACVYGTVDAEFTVAVVGDSHAANWVPALTRLSEGRQIRLESYSKSSCPLSAEAILTDRHRVSEHCLHWGQNVIEELAASRPDLVLVTNAQYRAASGAPLATGLAGAWRQLLEADLTVAVLMDTPYPGIHIPDCVASNEDALAECAVARDEALSLGGRAAQQEALDAVDGMPSIDLAALICPAEACSPVVGGVLVYSDSNHLTASYSETLAPALEQALDEEGLLGAEPAGG